MTNTQAYTLIICTECGAGRFQSIYPNMLGCTWCGDMIHMSDLTPDWDAHLFMTDDGLLAVTYDEPMDDDD